MERPDRLANEVPRVIPVHKVLLVDEALLANKDRAVLEDLRENEGR
jgi:hypothetical protein